MPISENLNLDYIDRQYTAWQNDPSAVSRDWRYFFEGFAVGFRRQPEEDGGTCTPSEMLKQARVEALKYRYRDLGHLLACLDPLSACPTSHPYLELSASGLDDEDLDTPFYSQCRGRDEKIPLREIITNLRETYCRAVGVEYMHLQDPDERGWLQERIEANRNRTGFDAARRKQILEKLTAASIFEQFLNKKYVGITRFSLEGGEGIIPMLDGLVNHAAENGTREIMLGMAHRGRLNVLHHILQKPLEHLFAEFEHCYNPDALVGAGDVKYHNGYLAEITAANGENLDIFLVNNPSHLEAVDPVVEGAARARQELLSEKPLEKVLPVLMHGDAAFAGQGVVAEVLNMSQLSGYLTGGTIHIIINNQIGYTTLPGDARSTRYSTDIAKMLMVPVFHVHGESPEALRHVIGLAVDYRMRFKKDVVIDVVCYRRYGHNEGDEPYFTQPLMYDRIKNRAPLYKTYSQELLEDGVVNQDEIAAIEEKYHAALNEAYEEIHGSACVFPEDRFYAIWDDFSEKWSDEPVETGVEKDALMALARKLNTVPEGFNLHRKLKKLMQRRLETVEKGEGIDWANAESLALATLLEEGTPVRLSGQDSGRGTFSQRHSVWFDTRSGESYLPLNHLSAQQAAFRVYNSLLAEYSVLGFEYGFAMMRPEALTIWEAQFGDFVNNAQSIIDLFIASGETKWQRQNGLVMLLPHGMEGLGPEHSSARLERFLQLCADNNMQVVNATTPAQYFHLLRRQMHMKTRKPLVVMTPKSLLRHPRAVSSLAALATGHFMPVMDDLQVGQNARRVLFCSGKIYYELLTRREAKQHTDTAIIRIEQFYPFPEKMLAKMIEARPDVKSWYWVQEEPENMSAWDFVGHRLARLANAHLKLVARPASASPASGFPAIYRRQQDGIVEKAFEG